MDHPNQGQTSQCKRGRFAPSPTGDIHFGSLYTAVASYLDSTSQGGEWVVRVENLDPPRIVAGSLQNILTALDVHGLQTTEPRVSQSQRLHLYDAALESLQMAGKLFYCTCTRKSLAALDGGYPGTCRTRRDPPEQGHAVRFRLDVDRAFTFTDQVQGRQEYAPGSLSDFIVKRRDGLHAYHLAVVVDDALQQVNSIVRGADLLDSTPLHILLQQALGYPTPEYLHLPVLTRNGQKLSKQHGAPPISLQRPVENLARALELLGQPVPQGGRPNDPAGLLAIAAGNWQRHLLPRETSIELTCS